MSINLRDYSFELLEEKCLPKYAITSSSIIKYLPLITKANRVRSVFMFWYFNTVPHLSTKFSKYVKPSHQIAKNINYQKMGRHLRQSTVMK
jgi:hypothetical protein